MSTLLSIVQIYFHTNKTIITQHIEKIHLR